MRGAVLGGVLLLAGCGQAADAPPQPDPVAQALHAATNSAAEDSFYTRTAWKPAWDAANVAALRGAVADRGAHALDLMPFDSGDTPAGTPAEAADVARTRAALAYAGALARGAVDPTKLHTIYTLPRPAPDLAAGLSAALREHRLGTWLDGLAPQNDAYLALAADYRAHADAPRPPGKAIPPLDRALSLGMTDPRVPAIARQLAAFGYLATPAAVDDAFTPDLAAAVMRLQADYGLKDDGVVRADVLSILNYRGSDRQKAVAVAMERLRWLERDAPATRIDVNIAAARLTYWRDGRIVDQRNVVVGAPRTKTPQIEAPLFRLVSRPSWTIPRSIIKHDNMAARSDASLARSGFRRTGKRIVQAPGPRNALGLVKFDMRDPYAIYLHDTPAKGLFAAADRHRSHGCVRVKDALGFADLLAEDGGVAEKWSRARANTSTASVALPAAIPVRLFYATVLLSDAGKPVVRADPYGWDAAVAKKLGFAAKAAPALATTPADAGP